MDDLISRKALLDELAKWRDNDELKLLRSLWERWARRVGIHVLINVVRLFPASKGVCAARVVQCGECKNWEDGWLGYCTKIHTAIPYDGFCSYGERKEKGDGRT